MTLEKSNLALAFQTQSRTPIQKESSPQQPNTIVPVSTIELFELAYSVADPESIERSPLLRPSLDSRLDLSRSTLGASPAARLAPVLSDLDTDKVDYQPRLNILKSQHSYDDDYSCVYIST